MAYTVERKVVTSDDCGGYTTDISTVLDFSTAEASVPENSEGRIGRTTRELELNRKKWVCERSKGDRSKDCDRAREFLGEERATELYRVTNVIKANKCKWRIQHALEICRCYRYFSREFFKFIQ